MIYKGDLTRKVYKVDSVFPRPSYFNPDNNNLKNRHIPLIDWDGNEVDFITIGDSFSNGDTQGLNPFYQDYIATYNNLKVLNIPRLFKIKGFFIDAFNYIEEIQILNNMGYLDKMKPKYILIESVERYSIQRFSKKLDFTKTDNKFFESLKLTKNIKTEKVIDDNIFSFLNLNNFKAIRNQILFNFTDEKLFSHVYIEKLKKDFFSSNDSNTLLFLKEDVDNTNLVTKEKIKILNNNFNKLSEILEKKGIKLYFMPVVDKYNLYSNYLVNGKSYPKSQFFEYLRELPKKYKFIDTKKILSRALNRGEIDIFYSDDTHWSYKASELIFKEVNFD
ncbi:alginate O-acetyltransferase AlgX-related protein [Halarcobacter sp.]|uniref:alginate O-acetyltransferase AlgX-related protein n=1 Tax=Halarcobacter sp. TaxID=2321133 RepID=UPI002AA91C93|nr:hypothetical protein [Halarcobacter sp.]